MLTTLPMLLAGLMGAAGVALAALAAHSAPSSGLDGASQMLLFHALAVLCAGALAASGRVSKGAAHFATFCWIIGAALFAGDVALRALAGHRLFPMAAPAGGTLLIVAWLLFALAAVMPRKP